MDPFQEYNSIILYRQQNPLDPSEYGEVHHIIPRSCGGCNKKWNLVRLPPEEHYRCHSLLPLIYTSGEEHAKMLTAWWWLHFDRRRKVEISEEEYGVLKRQLSRVQSEANKGKHLSEETKRKMAESRRGTHRSEETKQKMSEAHKGKPGTNKGKHFSEEHKRKISEAMKGRHHSEESRRKMSEAHEGMTYSAERNQRISESLKLRYAIGQRKAWNKGGHISEEQKRKISEASRKRLSQMN